MGRGDGSGRIVSPEGADDTGAGILHVDMDAFYASVEQLDDPTLKGKPIIIGAPESRSVVSSASYEARRFGVRSAMPVGQALRLCPTAIVVLPHFDRYLEKSAEVMKLFRDVTPLVEPLSIDEAFLDVRGARRLWGSPGVIARALRARVLDETGLTCSIGVAATKHVAKIASTISKPDGVLIVAEADTNAFLRPLPVRALWGIGPKAAESLEGRGIHTVADVLDTPRPVLERALGAAMGSRIWHLARGEDSRRVETHRVDKSVGHEETFHQDISDHAVLRSELRRLADKVGARLRTHGWEASTISIKVRYADWTTISRSQTLTEPTAVGKRIGDAAHELFATLDRALPVRLIGVRAEKLRPSRYAELALWDDDEDWRRVESALDGAAARFGRGAVTRATLIGKARGGGTLPSNPRPDRDD
ncbi:DNA polymerase IV [Microbacterium deminutum]|uniref:DNA polymerase IV n=1 Tax=Microbacterium deminutum TaxID=344164 RepID=A0ABN2R8X7_9MICO